MPELPEVEITRQKLLPLLRGRRILDFWTNWPRGLRAPGVGRRTAADMRGRKILEVERRGKVLFFKFSGQLPRTMAVHLGMSGRLEVANRRAKQSSKYGRSPVFANSNDVGRWVHFRWRLSGNRELCLVDPRKFGRVWYGGPEELRRDPYIASLGADTRSLPRLAFIAALSRRRGMIKPLLLRQDVLAGIGNIIADESLWRAGIHPRATAAALDGRSLAALHAGISKTIGAMLLSGGTSIRNFRHPDGRLGRYQERRLVYGKAGSPCPRCQMTLRRIVVGGRGTTICPQCQRSPD